MADYGWGTSWIGLEGPGGGGFSWDAYDASASGSIDPGLAIDQGNLIADPTATNPDSIDWNSFNASDPNASWASTAPPDSSGFVVPSGLNSFDPALLESSGVSPAIVASANEAWATLQSQDATASDKALAQQLLNEIDKQLQNDSGTIDFTNGAGKAPPSSAGSSSAGAPISSAGKPASNPGQSGAPSPVSAQQLNQALSAMGTSLMKAFSSLSQQSKALLGHSAATAQSVGGVPVTSTSSLVMILVVGGIFAGFMYFGNQRDEK